LRGPGERVQVNAYHDLPHSSEGFGSIAVFQRDQDHIRPEDPIPVGQGPFRLEPRNPGVRTGAKDITRPGSLEGPNDTSHAGFRSVEEIHFNSRRDGSREPHDFTCCERGHVPVHRNHGTRRGKKARGRGTFGDEARRARLFSEQVIPSLSSTVSDEPFGDDDPLLPAADEALSTD